MSENGTSMIRLHHMDRLDTRSSSLAGMQRMYEVDMIDSLAWMSVGNIRFAWDKLKQSRDVTQQENVCQETMLDKNFSTQP